MLPNKYFNILKKSKLKPSLLSIISFRHYIILKVKGTIVIRKPLIN